MRGRRFIPVAATVIIHGTLGVAISLSAPRPEPVSDPDDAPIEIVLLDSPARSPTPPASASLAEVAIPDAVATRVEPPPAGTDAREAETQSRRRESGHSPKRRPRPRAPSPDAEAPSGGPIVKMQGGSTVAAGPAGPTDDTRHVGDDSRSPPTKTSVLRGGDSEAPSAGCEDAAKPARPSSISRPAYTDAARAAGIEGKVRVEVEIDDLGKVGRVTVLTSLDPGLDAAAIRAMKMTRFEPAVRCGEPVSSTLRIAVRFAL